MSGGPYAMESWTPVTPRREDEDRATWKSDWHWVRKDKGPAAKVWRPRPAAIDAVMKCMGWTGLVFIPEMQVVDLSTGEVLWRRRWAGTDHPHPGPEISPSWADEAERRVRAELQAEAAAARAQELEWARDWYRRYGEVPEHTLLRLPELAAEIAAGTVPPAADTAEQGALVDDRDEMALAVEAAHGIPRRRPTPAVRPQPVGEQEALW